MTPDDLPTFLRDRLDDLEQAALAATPGPWYSDNGSVRHSGSSTSRSAPTSSRWGSYIAPVVGAYDGQHPTIADGVHIAANDPPAILADVAAKRQILDEHRPETNGACRVCTLGWSARPAAYPCPTARLLAEPFAAHPDYDERWKP